MKKKRPATGMGDVWCRQQSQYSAERELATLVEDSEVLTDDNI